MYLKNENFANLRNLTIGCITRLNLPENFWNWISHRDRTKGKTRIFFLLYYKISSINAYVKGRKCIKYKRSIRRIVETDCMFAVTKHFSSRVINGIARYFMRLLLQACSQTDTNVSFPTCGRCRPIKYWGCASGKCLLLLRRIDRCFKKLVNVAKNIKFYLNFSDLCCLEIPFRRGTKSSFIKAYCKICSNRWEKRDARSCLQTTLIKQINNSTSCNIHNSSKCWQTHLSRNMSHRDCGSALRFLQIKSSTRNDSRVHERQYIFFIPQSADAFRWRPPAGVPRSFVFVYRLDCCSRDKMPARE